LAFSDIILAGEMTVFPWDYQLGIEAKISYSIFVDILGEK
jgi:hypothetical protein